MQVPVSFPPHGRFELVMSTRLNTTDRVDPSSARIAIVEEHRLFADCLVSVLSMKGFAVLQVDTPRSGSVDDLQRRVLRTRAHVVLLDLDFLAMGDGPRLIALVSRAGVAVLVLAGTEDYALWGECIAAGARKVVSKSVPLGDVTATIRRIVQNRSVLEKDERDRLLGAWSTHRSRQDDSWTRLSRLTKREAEVLGHLSRGRTVKDIARRSVVSEATVRSQVKAVLSKLHVSSQIAAVGLSQAAGWRSPVD